MLGQLTKKWYAIHDYMLAKKIVEICYIGSLIPQIAGSVPRWRNSISVPRILRHVPPPVYILKLADGHVQHRDFHNLLAPSRQPHYLQQRQKMPVNSRILCSYNRRRLRIAPQHLLDESEIQTDVKRPSDMSKSRLDPKITGVSGISLSSSSIKNTQSEDSEDLQGLRSIFRRREALDQDENDMFALKRATPVYESDDEDCVSTPSKRQRTSQPEILNWEEELFADDGHYSVSFYRK